MKDSSIIFGHNDRVIQMRLKTAAMTAEEKNSILNGVAQNRKKNITALVSDGENITPYHLAEIKDQFLATNKEGRANIMGQYITKLAAAQEVIIWTEPTRTIIENPLRHRTLAILEQYAGNPNA